MSARRNGIEGIPAWGPAWRFMRSIKSTKVPVSKQIKALPVEPANSGSNRGRFHEGKLLRGEIQHAYNFQLGNNSSPGTGYLPRGGICYIVLTWHWTTRNIVAFQHQGKNQTKSTYSWGCKKTSLETRVPSGPQFKNKGVFLLFTGPLFLMNCSEHLSSQACLFQFGARNFLAELKHFCVRGMQLYLWSNSANAVHWCASFLNNAIIRPMKPLNKQCQCCALLWIFFW